MQQLSSLGFARITADDAQQQRARIALQFAEELAMLACSSAAEAPSRSAQARAMPLTCSAQQHLLPLLHLLSLLVRLLSFCLMHRRASEASTPTGSRLRSSPTFWLPTRAATALARRLPRCSEHTETAASLICLLLRCRDGLISSTNCCRSTRSICSCTQLLREARGSPVSLRRRPMQRKRSSDCFCRCVLPERHSTAASSAG
jgi:hypothetical protein